MSANLLNTYPAARSYIAQLHVYGSTRAAICDALAERFDMPVVPSGRWLTKVLNNDDELVRQIAELKRIKADVVAGDDDGETVKRPVNRALVDTVYMQFYEDCPATSTLAERPPPDDATAPAPAATADNLRDDDWWLDSAPDIAPTAEADAYMDPDFLTVMTSSEPMEQVAIPLLTDEERARIAHLLPPA